jgi:hypothetical protein
LSTKNTPYRAARSLQQSLDTASLLYGDPLMAKFELRGSVKAHGKKNQSDPRHWSAIPDGEFVVPRCPSGCKANPPRCG